MTDLDLPVERLVTLVVLVEPYLCVTVSLNSPIINFQNI